jgi:hypothetical protein
LLFCPLDLSPSCPFYLLLFRPLALSPITLSPSVLIAHLHSTLNCIF